MSKLEVLELLEKLLQDCAVDMGDGAWSWPSTKVVNMENLQDNIAREIADEEMP